jgi:hypothetical protein
LGRVHDVGSRGSKIAWLSEFGIDQARLKPAHTAWLEAQLILSIESQSTLDADPVSTGEFWQIWVIGAASRTAGFGHNLSLSRRRAEAVRAYLARRMKHFMTAWNIDILALSEAPATIMGRKNDAEYAFDRAVLVIAKKIGAKEDKPPPTPVIIPPVFCENIVKVRFSVWIEGTSLFVPFTAKWVGWLFATYDDKFYGDGVCDRWLLTASGVENVSKLPGLPGRGKPKIPGNPGSSGFYAGYESRDFGLPRGLDDLNGQTIVFTLQSNGLFLNIELPQGRAMQLKLAVDRDEISRFKMAKMIGSLRQRERLPQVPWLPEMVNGKWVWLS